MSQRRFLLYAVHWFINEMYTRSMEEAEGIVSLCVHVCGFCREELRTQNIDSTVYYSEGFTVVHYCINDNQSGREPMASLYVYKPEKRTVLKICKNIYILIHKYDPAL